MKKELEKVSAEANVLLPAAMMGEQPVVSSLEVAKILGLRHNHLLRSIREYYKIISKKDVTKIGRVSPTPIRQEDFFVPSTYINHQNQTNPCYLLTQKGCEMVANKLTGEKGVLFTAAYVNAFHALQEQAQAGTLVPTVAPPPTEPVAQDVAAMDAETRLNNSRMKLARMWLDLAEHSNKNKRGRYQQYAEDALLGRTTPTR